MKQDQDKVRQRLGMTWVGGGKDDDEDDNVAGIIINK